MASGRGLLDRGLVVARGRAERDIEPVPPVDGNDTQRQLRELLVAEFFPSLVINLVGNFLVCQAGDRFGPGKGRALARYTNPGPRARPKACKCVAPSRRARANPWHACRDSRRIR